MTIIKPYFSARSKLKIGLDEIKRFADADAQRIVLTILASILENGLQAGPVVEGRDFVQANARFLDTKPGGTELKTAYLAIVQGREGYYADDFVDFVCRFSDEALAGVPFESERETTLMNMPTLDASSTAAMISKETTLDDSVVEAVVDRFDREDKRPESTRKKDVFVLNVFYVRLRLHSKNAAYPPGAFMNAVGELAAYLGGGVKGVDVAAFRYFVDLMRALAQCNHDPKRRLMIALKWADEIFEAADPFVSSHKNRLLTSMKSVALVYLGKSFEYATATAASAARIDESDPNRPKLLWH